MADIAQALTEAVALHRAGQGARAEQAYRQILQDQPECADAWHLLGVLTCQAGRRLAAAGCIGHAIGLDPGASSYHNSLGVAYRGLKKLDDALVCYRRALELKPDYPEAHNNLGVILREFGKLDEAAASYRRAIELKPDYAEALQQPRHRAHGSSENGRSDRRFPESFGTQARHSRSAQQHGPCLAGAKEDGRGRRLRSPGTGT